MPAKVQFPALSDYDWLYARFVHDGLSRVEIAALVGCSGSPVGKALRNLGIERPNDWTRPARNGAAPAPPTFDAIDAELAELVNEKRHGPAPVEREFVPALPEVVSARADIDPPRGHGHGGEVPVDELRHRAHEGLQVLAELMDVHLHGGEGELYDLVMERLEPAEARMVAFAAAVVAQEQANTLTAIGA